MSTETETIPTWDNGRIEDESNGHYHACPAISASKLKVFRKSALLFYRCYIARTVPAPVATPEQIVGQAGHVLILEGIDAYARQVAIRPDGIDRRTKEGKADWAEFCRQSEGKIIIDGDQAITIARMAQSVRENPAASALLSGCKPEISWRAEMGSMRVQCRTDAWGENSVEVPFDDGPRMVGLRVVDLKTCESVNGGDYGAFQKQFFDLGYYRQAGFYIALLHSLVPKEQIPVDGIPFFFVAVEKNEPFQTLVVEPDQRALAEGISEAMKDLRALRECMQTGIWPGTPQTVQRISLPGFYIRELDKKEKEAA